MLHKRIRYTFLPTTSVYTTLSTKSICLRCQRRLLLTPLSRLLPQVQDRRAYRSSRVLLIPPVTDKDASSSTQTTDAAKTNSKKFEEEKKPTRSQKPSLIERLKDWFGMQSEKVEGSDGVSADLDKVIMQKEEPEDDISSSEAIWGRHKREAMREVWEIEETFNKLNEEELYLVSWMRRANFLRGSLKKAQEAIAVDKISTNNINSESKEEEAAYKLRLLEPKLRTLIDDAIQKGYRMEAIGKAVTALETLSKEEFIIFTGQQKVMRWRRMLEEAKEAITVNIATDDTADQERQKRKAAEKLRDHESKLQRKLPEEETAKSLKQHELRTESMPGEERSEKSRKVLTMEEKRLLERIMSVRNLKWSLEKADRVSTVAEDMDKKKLEKTVILQKLSEAERWLETNSGGRTPLQDLMQMSDEKIKGMIVEDNVRRTEWNVKEKAEQARSGRVPDKASVSRTKARDNNPMDKVAQKRNAEEMSNEKRKERKAANEEQRKDREAADDEKREKRRLEERLRSIEEKLAIVMAAGTTYKEPHKVSAREREFEDGDTSDGPAREESVREASNKKHHETTAVGDMKHTERTFLEKKLKRLNTELETLNAASVARKEYYKLTTPKRDTEDSNSSGEAAQEEDMKRGSDLESLAKNSPAISKKIRKRITRVRGEILMVIGELSVIGESDKVGVQKEEHKDDSSSDKVGVKKEEHKDDSSSDKVGVQKEEHKDDSSSDKVGVQKEEPKDESSPDTVSQEKTDTTTVRRIRSGKPKMQVRKAMKTKSFQIRRLMSKTPKLEARTFISTIREKAAQLESRRKILLSRRNELAQEGTKDDDVLPHKDLKSAILEAKAPLNNLSFESINAGDLELAAIEIDQTPAPRLAYGLDRALFHQGVTQTRDSRSGVYNFDPSLESLIPVDEFDFGLLKGFTTPSQDKVLDQLARESNKKYVASTSSMTGILSHFHFLLSHQRSVNTKMISADFPLKSSNYTKITQAPASVFLRWQDGKYAVDANKEWDGPNILSMMGRYMERLLTVDKDTFERHQIGSSNPLAKEDASSGDAYHYSTIGDFLIRSQLDAADRRLPGSGVFDLKTRAVLPIRMSTKDFTWAMEYEIQSMRGEYNSFEREYYDMIRSTMLKYSLQVRLGRMDGIFVAYHNIAKIFGFQYISIADMDEALHGQRDPTLGDQELLLSLHILNQVFNKAAAKFPEQSLRLTFETRPVNKPFMYIFAEPVAEEEIGESQNRTKDLIEAFESEVLRRDTSSDASELGVNERMTMFKARLSNFNFRKLAASASKVENAGSSSEITQSEDSPQTATESFSAPVLEDGTDASADETSTATIKPEAEAKPETKPLLAMTMTVQNRINNKHELRPELISTKEGDEWGVDYRFSDIKRVNRALQLYEACKTRRRSLLENSIGTEEEASEASVKDDYFIRMLKQVTQRSRESAAALREGDVEGETKMWNQP